MVNSHASKNEIGQIVWAACDTFRGAVDPSEYKNYILTMLFVKYLSDLRKDILADYTQSKLSKERYGTKNYSEFRKAIVQRGYGPFKEDLIQILLRGYGPF